nr:WD40 repeat domain-containing protein [Methylobacterium sp. L1A1]
MTGPVFDAAFGPAPGQLTLNAWDKNLEVWSLRPMRRLRMFAVARDTVGGSVSPEGRLVLTNASGKPQLVDISSGSVVLNLPPGASPLGAFHPKRPLFLLVSAEEVTLLEPSGGLLARAAIRSAASEVGYASDGSLAFVRQTNGDIVVLDGLTLDRKVVLPGHDEFSRVILLPACRTAVTTSRPGRVHVWDLSSGASRYEFSMRDELPRLSASPDCARLSIIGDDLIRVLSLADGSDIAVLKGHSAKIRFAKFLPQSGTMLSADEAGTIHRWRLPRSIGDLVLDAEQSLPRRLSADQERRFGLR